MLEREWDDVFSNVTYRRLKIGSIHFEFSYAAGYPLPFLDQSSDDARPQIGRSSGWWVWEAVTLRDQAEGQPFLPKQEVPVSRRRRRRGMTAFSDGAPRRSGPCSRRDSSGKEIP